MNQIDYLNALADAPDWERQFVVSKKKKGGRGGTPTSLISEGGAVAGGVTGAALGSVVPVIGTAIGGILGAGIGAFGGRLAENKVRDDRFGLMDATKEGALTTLLAGPLKLGKYAATAGKAAGSRGLTEALTTGAQAAEKATLKNTVGRSVGSKADNLVTKNLRLTPSQLDKYKNKFGEDVSQTIKKYGLVGKDSQAIKATVDGLQGEYDTIAGAIPNISKTALVDSFKKKISKLESSAVEDNIAIAKQLKSQLNTLTKKYGDEIPASELNAVRREFDSLINYSDKIANPARYSVNKRSADALRGTLQGAADSAGLKSSAGSTFKDVGRELQKLRQLEGYAAKQENLGRGSLPFGITPLLGAIVGSGAGPVGTAATMGATAAANSGASRSVLAKGADKLAGALAGDGANAVRTGLRRGAQGAILSAPFAQSTNSDQSMSPTNTTSPMSNASNIPSEYSDQLNQSIEPQASSPFDPANVEANVSHILSNGGDMKDVGEYLSLVEALQKVTGTNTKPMSAESAKVVTNAQTGLQALSDFASIIQSDPSALTKSVIPGRSVAGGVLGRALGTQSLDAARQQVVDIIARLRTGAAITQSEEQRFVQFLPTAADTPEVAQQKIGYLYNQFNDILARVQAGSPSAQELVSSLGL